MSQLTTMINELKPLVQKYQTEIDELEIMKKFITTTKELFESWQSAQNKEQSICGAQIPFGELTFQCFTCAPDPHHMFCYKCFNPQKHLNHKSIIKHDIGGACDCGDEQTIKESGFCKNHKGFSKMDQQGELAKIPQQLKTQIENFIKACCHIYIPLMKNLRPNYKKYSILALQMYNVSERFGIQDFKNIIDSAINLEEYYKTFQQALYVHEILFSVLSCLIEERFCFILLVSSILRQKLTEDSQDSIIEEIIENLVLLETQGPRQSYRLEKFFFSLFADYTFKEFMQQVYLKKNSCLWLQNTVFTIQESKGLSEFIQKIESIPPNVKIQLNQDFIKQIGNQLERYLQSLKKEEFPATYFFTSEVQELHTQYVSEKLQQIFFSNPNIGNLYKQIKNNLQTIQLERINSITQVMQFEPLNLRIEYEFFDKIVFLNLKKILGENYEIFMNQSLNKDILEKFPYKEFFLTALIDCSSNLQPVKIDLQEKELTIGQEDHFDSVYYLMQQAFYIKAIQGGLSKIINSQNSTPNMIENFNIILLHQCYNQLKNGRNKKVSVDAELQLALEKYIFNQQLKDKQVFDRMSKIYLMLIKSDTYTDKVFILILCNLYCLKQFKSGQEFKLFLSKSLNEDINELQRQFYFILTRCLQTYTSIQYCQNQYLENVYLGLNNLQDGQQLAMLESFDTSFFRLHIFLFDQTGFADFIEIIKNRFIPLPTEQLRLLCSLILRMIGSDLDVYNVCSKSIKILPNDLKLSLAKLVQNFANLTIYQEFPTIESRMQQLGIMTSLNLPDHLLQIFEVDQSVKKLKLKSEYQPIYDPAIFHISTSLTSQIVEKFIQQEKPQHLIQLGDGINWDVEKFSSNNYRRILKSLLQFYCTKPYIDKNLEFLNFQGQFLVQAYQLIYIQIIASSYFRKQELQNEAPIYIKVLEEIKEKTQRKDDILRLNVLIEQIQNIIFQKKQEIQLENQQSNPEKVKSKQFILKKSQLKAKFEKLKNNDELIQQVEKITIDTLDLENCHSCRMNLFDQESSILILLVQKPATDLLELHQQVFPQQLKSVQLDLAHIGISTCKHYFHKNCLVERFESSTKNVLPTLPDWVKLGCPICKQACIFTIPASKEISVSQANEFNEQLMSYLILNEQAYSSLLEEEPFKCLLLTYFNLFFDLITSLIQSPADFKRDQKYVVFNQLLRIFQQSRKEQLKEEFEFFQIPEKNDSLITQILKIIYEDLCIKGNLQITQNQIYILLQTSNLNEEYNYLIQKSFQFTNVNIIENNQNQNGFIFKEIQFYSQLTSQIAQALRMRIGNNFQDFYCKYFLQGCSYCSFYNKDQRGNVDFSLCLLCLKCFCHFSCQKKQIGNLNHHSKATHSGNSIFVSLRTGNVTIVSSPISISHFKCLFYNQLGQKVNVQFNFKNWETYMIDLEKIKELAIIIQNNNYQTIVRNLEVRQNQLDLNGLL